MQEQQKSWLTVKTLKDWLISTDVEEQKKLEVFIFDRSIGDYIDNAKIVDGDYKLGELMTKTGSIGEVVANGKTAWLEAPEHFPGGKITFDTLDETDHKWKRLQVILDDDCKIGYRGPIIVADKFKDVNVAIKRNDDGFTFE